MNCNGGFVKNTILTARDDDAGRRLDRVLRKALPGMPLSALHKLFRKGKVLVNGFPARAGDRITSGARIELYVQFPGGRGKTADPAPGADSRGGRSAAKLDILREGAGLLVVNKAAGLAVHGGTNSSGTLNSRVQAYLKGKLPASLSFRPGPLHRLDKPTSGIIVFATSLDGARQFSALLQEGGIRKTYVTIVEGTLRQSEVWEDTLVRDKTLRKTFAGENGAENGAASSGAPFSGETTSGGGKRARCRVSPLAQTERQGRALSLIRVELQTGRTHQIRAQAAAHGHPLAGDGKYGGKPLPEGAVSGGRPRGGRAFGGGFFLHAAELELPHEPALFPGIPRPLKAPLPQAFTLAIRNLFGDTLNTSPLDK